MRLQTETCDACTLTLPAEDVTVMVSPCQRYQLAECDQCREGTGLKEFWPVDPNRA